MDKIAFVIWMIAWPLACTIDSYFAAKRKVLTNEEQLSKEDRKVNGFIELLIWIIIAIVIY
jgi:hypothetical protein